MKTKLSKIAKIVATGLFLFALALNVKVSLDDPFELMSDEVVAFTHGIVSDGTDSGSTGDGGGGTGDDNTAPPKCTFSGQIVHYWSKNSKEFSYLNALQFQSSATSTQTAVNGDVAVGDKNFKVGGGACSSASFNTGIIHYSCKVDLLSPKCAHNQQKTVWTCTAVN